MWTHPNLVVWDMTKRAHQSQANISPCCDPNHLGQELDREHTYSHLCGRGSVERHHGVQTKLETSTPPKVIHFSRNTLAAYLINHANTPRVVVRARLKTSSAGQSMPTIYSTPWIIPRVISLHLFSMFVMYTHYMHSTHANTHTPTAGRSVGLRHWA